MRCSRGRGEDFSGAREVFPVGVSKVYGSGRGSRLGEMYRMHGFLMFPSWLSTIGHVLVVSYHAARMSGMRLPSKLAQAHYDTLHSIYLLLLPQLTLLRNNNYYIRMQSCSFTVSTLPVCVRSTLLGWSLPSVGCGCSHEVGFVYTWGMIALLVKF